MNELIEIPKETSLEVFTAKNGLDPYIQQIIDEVASFIPDLTTNKGRAAIASMAAKVAKSKVYLDNEGKTLVAKLKEQPKLVDAERKRMRDLLDALRDKTRKPLTDWEDAETARTDAIKQRISNIKMLFEMPVIDLPSDILKSRLNKLELTVIDDSFGEFKGEAAIAKDKATIQSKIDLAAAIKRESDKAELERLQKESAEREQKEREEKLVKDAEERVKSEAQSKIDAANKSEENAKLEVERLKQKAIDDESVIIEPEMIAGDPKNRIGCMDYSKEATPHTDHSQKKNNPGVLESIQSFPKESSINAFQIPNDVIQNAAILSLIKCSIDEETAGFIIRLISDGKIDNVTIKY